MLPITLTALSLVAGVEAEPAGANATKVIARCPWPHAAVEAKTPGKDRIQLVLRSAAELVAAVPTYKNRDALPAVVEKAATADLATALKVEDIDWTKQMVVVVSAGSQSTGGHRVEVTNLEMKDRTMTVKWQHVAPRGIATQAFTHPAEAVLVPTFAGKVVFDPAKDK